MRFIRVIHFLLIAAAILLLVSGCAPRDVVTEDEEDVFTEKLREYEREFDPTEFNTPFAIQKENDSVRDESPDIIPETDEPDAPTFIQGFRIQLYSTSDMEAAQEVHAAADSIFTDHWVYIVYEVPFYKVRLGDFESRPFANRAITSVVRQGFRDAWIVPDRVIKDPPEKFLEEDEEDTEGIIQPPGGPNYLMRK